jgi:hypothetical protein
MHAYALIAAHMGLHVHSITLTTLWSIVLAATVVGSSVSVMRIVHGIRHLHVDLTQSA